MNVSLQLNPLAASSGLRYVCLCPAYTETAMFTNSENLIHMPGNEAIAESVESYGLNK
jgi:hypothetical protein